MRESSIAMIGQERDESRVSGFGFRVCVLVTRHSLLPIIACAFLSLPSPVHAAFTNGASAVDLLGQYDASTSAPIPRYTKAAANNGPNQFGYNTPSTGIALDSSGDRLFVADGANNRVLVYALNTNDTLVDRIPDYVLGQYEFSTNTAAVTQAGMSGPTGLAFDDANDRLFVAQTTANRVTVYDVALITNGEDATAVLGQANYTASSAATTQAGLSAPASLAYDGANALLYVADAGNHRVMIFDVTSITNGENATDLLGQYVSATGSSVVTFAKGGANNGANAYGYSMHATNLVTSSALDPTGDRLFVVDSANNRVVVYNLNAGDSLVDRVPDNVLGQRSFTGSAAANTQAGMNIPVAVAFDDANDRLFVAQAGNHRVTVYDVAAITDGENATAVLGQANYTATAAANTQAGMNTPSGVAYFANKLYVAQTGNNRVTVYDVTAITNGENAANVLGQANFTATAAANTQAGMSTPMGLGIDETGNRLFVAGAGNHRVTVYDVAAITDGENAVNVLGQANFTASAAANTQGGMSAPRSVAFDDANDDLYVVQSGNNRVTVYDVAAITDGENATAVLGQANYTATAAANTQAGLNGPTGLVYVPGNTRLYVTQVTGHRMSVFDVAAITNGENAADMLGQYDNATPPGPDYTKSGVNNGPNKLGFNFTSSFPTMVLDGSDNLLFVSDPVNNRVLVFGLNANDTLVDRTPDNVLGQTTFAAGAAANTQGGMSTPVGLAYDASGNRLFVAGAGNHRVTVYDVAAITDGENATAVLGQANYTASAAANTQAGLNTPRGLFFDAANSLLYVSQTGNHRLSVFDVAAISNGENAANGLGQYDDSTSAPAPVYTKTLVNNGPNRYGFNMTAAPSDLAFDTTNHRLFVVDNSNNRVLVYDLNADNVLTNRMPDYVLGQTNYYSNGAANTQAGMSSPRSLAIDVATGRLFVSQAGNHRVTVYDVASITDGENATKVLGQANFTASAAANTQAGMNTPGGIDFDPDTGYLYVSQSGNNRVTVYDVAAITDGENAINVLGQANFTATAAANTQAGMNSPTDVAVDTSVNRLYVSQTGNNRVTVYDVAAITDGENATAVLGQANYTATATANTQAGMNVPRGVAVDATTQRLFVTQSGNNRVTVYDVTAITNGENAINVLGQLNYTATAAANTQAGLSSPLSAVLHPGGKHLYIAQSGNFRVSVFPVEDMIVTGRAFLNAGTVPVTQGTTIAMSINGGAAIDTTVTNAAGAFTLSGATLTGGTIVSLYMDGASEKAVHVSLGSGSSMTGIHLYANHLIAGSYSGATAITTANIAVADNNADADITTLYGITSTTLNVKAGKSLVVWGRNGFTPGGVVNVGSGVTVSAPLRLGSNTLTLSGSWITQAGGSFTGTSVVTFEGTSASTRTITSNGSVFSGVTIAGGSSAIYSLGDALRASGSLILSGGTYTFDANDENLSVDGNISIANSAIAMGNGTWNLAGNWDSSDSSGVSPENSTLVLTGSGKTLEVVSDAMTDFSGLTVTGYLSIINDATANDQIVGAAAAVIVGTGAKLTLQTPTNSESVGLFLSAGSSDLIVYTNGMLTGGGDFIMGSGASISAQRGFFDHGVIVFGQHIGNGNSIAAGRYAGQLMLADSAGVPLTTLEPASGTTTFTDLVFLDAGGTRSAVDARDTDGTLVFTATSVNLRDVFGGPRTMRWVAGNGSLAFSGSNAMTFFPSGQTFGHLVLNNASTVTVAGTGAFASVTQQRGTFLQKQYALDINGTLSMSGGTFHSGWGTLTLSGSLMNDGGTFTTTTGSTVLDGANQTITGSNLFYNLTKNVTTARTLTFAATATQTVSGSLVLQGAADQLLSLRSTMTGVPWKINPAGSRTVNYLDVRDSTNLHPTEITCLTTTNHCADATGNTNWIFAAGSPPALRGDYFYFLE